METIVSIFNVVVGLGMLVALLSSPYWVIKWLRRVDRRSADRNHVRLEREHQRTAAALPGRPERAFLKSCTNCSAFALTLPYRDALGRTYCSAACMQWLGEGPRGFCRKCQFETGTAASGNLQRINGIGTAFVGSSEACPTCRSVVRRVWFTVLFLPVIPLARYRVLHISPREFYSRRLRNA